MTGRAQWGRGIGHPPVVTVAMFEGRVKVRAFAGSLTAATFGGAAGLGDAGASMTAASFTGSVVVTP